MLSAWLNENERDKKFDEELDIIKIYETKMEEIHGASDVQVNRKHRKAIIQDLVTNFKHNAPTIEDIVEPSAVLALRDASSWAWRPKKRSRVQGILQQDMPGE